MRTITFMLFAAFSLALLGCGGADTPEAMARESIEQQKRTLKILEGVDDESSARAAGRELAALAKRELENPPAQRMQEMVQSGEYTEADFNNLPKELQDELGEVSMKVFAEMMRIQANANLQEAMTEGISEAME